MTILESVSSLIAISNILMYLKGFGSARLLFILFLTIWILKTSSRAEAEELCRFFEKTMDVPEENGRLVSAMLAGESADSCVFFVCMGGCFIFPMANHKYVSKT